MSVERVDELILAVGLRRPSGNTIAWLERQVLRLSAPEPAVYLQVVLPSVDTDPVVGESARQAMVHFARACQPQLRGAAFVLLLDGFLGATVRSVLSAATMAARPQIPVKVFSSVPEGVMWLGRATMRRLPALELVEGSVSRAAQAMRVRLGGSVSP